MRFSCPGCGRVIMVRDEYAGRKGHCPACGQSIVIPHPSPPPEDSPAHPHLKSKAEKKPALPSGIQCPKCRKSFPMKSELAGKKVRCPVCKTGFTVPGGTPETHISEKKEDQTPAPSSLPPVPEQKAPNVQPPRKEIPSKASEEIVPASFFKKFVFIRPQEQKTVFEIIIGSAVIGAVCGWFGYGLYDMPENRKIMGAAVNLFLFAGWGISEIVGMVWARNFKLTGSRTGLVLYAAFFGAVWVGIFTAASALQDTEYLISRHLRVTGTGIIGFIVGGLISIVFAVRPSGAFRLPDEDRLTISEKDKISARRTAIGCGLGCLTVLILIGVLAGSFLYPLYEFGKGMKEMEAEPAVSEKRRIKGDSPPESSAAGRRQAGQDRIRNQQASEEDGKIRAGEKIEGGKHRPLFR